MLEFLLVIPARYKSSRLPGKPLININGIPMIIRTCMQCSKAVSKKNIVVTGTRNEVVQKDSPVRVEVISNEQVHTSAMVNIGDLLKIYGLKLSNYVSHNRENSAVGEKAETEVAEYLSEKGYKILYSGGDGDPIDMSYGCDLIVAKPGDENETRPLTIQVKLKELSAVKASKKSNYSSIDLFYWSDGGNVGCVGGEDVGSLF